MYVYVVEYEGKVSSEGYNTIEKAIDYITRCGGILEKGWLFKDSEDNYYRIKEIKIV